MWRVAVTRVAASMNNLVPIGRSGGLLTSRPWSKFALAIETRHVLLPVRQPAHLEFSSGSPQPILSSNRAAFASFLIGSSSNIDSLISM
jgi:hypothetical protein